MIIFAYSESGIEFSEILNFYEGLYPERFKPYKNLTSENWPSFLNYLNDLSDQQGETLNLFFILDLDSADFEKYTSLLNDNKFRDLSAFRINYFIINVDEENFEKLKLFNKMILQGSSAFAYCVGKSFFSGESLEREDLLELFEGYLFSIINGSFTYEEESDPFFFQTNKSQETNHCRIWNFLLCELPYAKQINNELLGLSHKFWNKWHKCKLAPVKNEPNIPFSNAVLENGQETIISNPGAVPLSYQELLHGADTLIESVFRPIIKQAKENFPDISELLRNMNMVFQNEEYSETSKIIESFKQATQKYYKLDNQFCFNRLKYFCERLLERYNRKVEENVSSLPEINFDVSVDEIRSEINILCSKAKQIDRWKNNKSKLIMISLLSSLLLFVVLFYIFYYVVPFLNTSDTIYLCITLAILIPAFTCIVIYFRVLNNLVRQYKNAFNKAFNAFCESINNKYRNIKAVLFNFVKSVNQKKVYKNIDLYIRCFYQNVEKTEIMFHRWLFNQHKFVLNASQTTFNFPININFTSSTKTKMLNKEYENIFELNIYSDSTGFVDFGLEKKLSKVYYNALKNGLNNLKLSRIVFPNSHSVKNSISEKLNIICLQKVMFSQKIITSPARSTAPKKERSFIQYNESLEPLSLMNDRVYNKYRLNNNDFQAIIYSHIYNIPLEC